MRLIDFLKDWFQMFLPPLILTAKEDLVFFSHSNERKK